jgi:hypothetical protein
MKEDAPQMEPPTTFTMEQRRILGMPANGTDPRIRPIEDDNPLFWEDKEAVPSNDNALKLQREGEGRDLSQQLADTAQLRALDSQYVYLLN